MLDHANVLFVLETAKHFQCSGDSNNGHPTIWMHFKTRLFCVSVRPFEFFFAEYATDSYDSIRG